MPSSNSREKSKRSRKFLLSLTQDLGNCVPDCSSCLLDLLFGKAEGDADLQTSGDNLLRLEIVSQGLEPANKNAVGKALHRYRLVKSLSG